MKKAKKRQCGTCTECCTSLGVKELSKPEGVACQYLGEKGCGTYDDRPASCRAFECLWLQGWIDGPFRPDRVGLVFDVATGDVYPQGQALVARVTRPGAATSGDGFVLIQQLATRMLLVVVEDGNRRLLGPPDQVVIVQRNLILRKTEGD